MKIAPYFILTILVFTSCMTTSRMDKVVATYYAEKNKGFIKSFEVKNCEVSYAKLKQVNGFSKSRYKNFFVVPLLVYYFSYEKIHCQVNPKVVATPFARELSDWLNQQYYSDKLKDKQLEIEFVKMPNSFIHVYESQLLALPYSTGISIVENDFLSDSGYVEINCILKDSNGTIIKSINLSEKLDPVRISNYGNGRRKYFIIQGLDFVSERYEETFRKLIQNMLEEI